MLFVAERAPRSVRPLAVPLVRAGPALSLLPSVADVEAASTQSRRKTCPRLAPGILSPQLSLLLLSTLRTSLTLLLEPKGGGNTPIPPLIPQDQRVPLLPVLGGTLTRISSQRLLQHSVDLLNPNQTPPCVTWGVELLPHCVQIQLPP